MILNRRAVMNSREKVEKAYGDSLLLRYEEKINMFTELLDSHAAEAIAQHEREKKDETD